MMDEELYKALKASVEAIEYALRHYVVSESSKAEVLSFINGYNGSVDTYKVIKEYERIRGDLT